MTVSLEERPQLIAKGGAGRTCTAHPYALAGLGTVVLWALSISIGLIYQTIHGSPIGRVNDFLTEADPPLRQLYDGHVLGFLQISPAYVGSLILRAPFASLGMSLHADWQVVYILTSLPCLMAAPIFGAWLAHITVPEAGFRPVWVWLSPFGVLLVINPILIDCLILGHPEDLLGAALAIAGVIQAARGKELAQILLLGASVFNKSWAIVAVPVALALLPRLSKRAILLLLLPVVVLYVPVALIQHGGSLGASTGSGGIFLATQLWWWFGKSSFVAVHAHLLIVVMAILLAGAWRVRRRAACTTQTQLLREGLLLLALVFLLRAAMDPWNNIYYSLPFLMVVFTLEIGKAPRWSLASTLLMVAVTIPLRTSTLDTRAVAYQLGTVPLIIGLGLRVFLSTDAWERLNATMNRRVSVTR